MIEAGKMYVNKRGDVVGPMAKVNSAWLCDQYRRLYTLDGVQVGHIKESTGNITMERCQSYEQQWPNSSAEPQ